MDADAADTLQALLEDAVDAGTFRQPASLEVGTLMTTPGHVQDEPDNATTPDGVCEAHPRSQREPSSEPSVASSGRVGHPQVSGEAPVLHLPELRPFSIRGMLMHAMLSYRVASEGVAGNGFVKELYDELLRLSISEHDDTLHLPFSGLGKFPHFLNQSQDAGSSRREKQVSSLPGTYSCVHCLGHMAPFPPAPAFKLRFNIVNPRARLGQDILGQGMPGGQEELAGGVCSGPLPLHGHRAAALRQQSSQR